LVDDTRQATDCTFGERLMPCSRFHDNDDIVVDFIDFDL